MTCILKHAGLFQPKFGSNMDKCWVKNVKKKCTVESVYLTQIWIKTTQHCLQSVKKPITLKRAGFTLKNAGLF